MIKDSKSSSKRIMIMILFFTQDVLTAPSECSLVSSTNGLFVNMLTILSSFLEEVPSLP